MKKFIIFIVILIWAGGASFFIVSSIYKKRTIEVTNAKYFVEENKINVELKVNSNSDVLCIYNQIDYKADNKVCKFSVEDYVDYVIIKNEYNSIQFFLNDEKKKTKTNKIEGVLENNLVYVGEKAFIKYKYETTGYPNKDVTITSENPEIAEIVDGYVVGKAKGNTKIVIELGDKKDELDLEVTDLISAPYWIGQDRKKLPCNAYTEEEAALLDQLLEREVNKAGYGTRAGVVAAARFLTLQFKYRVPYFFENGRVDFVDDDGKVKNTGVNKAEGEGRYYKKGLYLAPSKKKEIKYTFAGPATWGCPLRNFEPKPERGYVKYAMMPNGLDCSGFISWAFVQGGFDPGDIGAGESAGTQFTDKGKYTKLTRELFDNGTIKTGDLMNFQGHIAIIVGITGEDVYVAESLSFRSFDGVTVKKYQKGTINRTFPHVVLMDEYYKNDGNYTEHWE